MKTIDDLNALIPTLCDLVAYNDHEINSSNYVRYEQDGWLIEISYVCTGEVYVDYGDYWTPPSGELLNGRGETTEIIVTHYDEETEEETEFSDDELDELWSALDEALENL